MGKIHFIDNGSSSIQQHKIYLLGAANSAKGFRKKEAGAGGFDPDTAARSFLQHIVHIEKIGGTASRPLPLVTFNQGVAYCSIHCAFRFFFSISSVNLPSVWLLC